MSNVALVTRRIPRITPYEIERQDVFRKLTDELIQRKEKHGALFTVNINEAMVLNAMLPYLENLSEFSKITGISKKHLEIIKAQDYTQFYDNVFQSRGRKALHEHYSLMEKADSIVGERLERSDTKAIEAAHISKIYFEMVQPKDKVVAIDTTKGMGITNIENQLVIIANQINGIDQDRVTDTKPRRQFVQNTNGPTVSYDEGTMQNLFRNIREET